MRSWNLRSANLWTNGVLRLKILTSLSRSLSVVCSHNGFTSARNRSVAVTRISLYGIDSLTPCDVLMLPSNLKYYKMYQFPKLKHFLHLILPLSLPNPLKPDVKLRKKMYLEQHWCNAPATSEWSKILLPTKVWLILEVWWYIAT